MKNFAPVMALISFWGWVCVILLSFMLAVVAFVAGAVPVVVVFVVAFVIFAVSLTVVILNPGIFAKQHTTETAE